MRATTPSFSSSFLSWSITGARYASVLPEPENQMNRYTHVQSQKLLEIIPIELIGPPVHHPDAYESVLLDGTRSAHAIGGCYRLS